MNNMLEANTDEKWVRVQPGITQGGLNDLLKPRKLFFPIDPSTKEHCTFGGMIANNSSGSHVSAFGTTGDDSGIAHTASTLFLTAAMFP